MVDLQKNKKINKIGGVRIHTAAAVLKTSLLQKQIKNRPTLAYKNSVRKCYQVLLFSRNVQFNNPTSIPQT